MVLRPRGRGRVGRRRHLQSIRPVGFCPRGVSHFGATRGIGGTRQVPPRRSIGSARGPGLTRRSPRGWPRSSNSDLLIPDRDRPLLANVYAVRTYLGLLAGSVVGYILMRERHARRTSERIAAAALESILNAIEANDRQTGRHVRRVAAYALILADAADLDERERRSVERAALFHDIGKIDEALFDIIHEPSALTPTERRAIATHPKRGADVLAPLTPFYPDLAESVLSHHERWDGSGYPRGLAGDEIPLTARIVSLADSFDAITHNRRYRDGRNASEAASAIMAARGTQFDPQLVDLMLLPPIFERLIRAHREFFRSHPRRSERRVGQEEHNVPDVTFRWRTEQLAPRQSPPAVGAHSETR
jgi:hypothetical protein